MSTIPTYEMCNYHDAQVHNRCRRHQENDQGIFKNAQRTYREYQHWLGPTDNSKNLWYSFQVKNCHFFVFDTRTERDAIDIISVPQMKAFKHWISDPNKTDDIKFIVSSTPFCSQATGDSWYGFPVQQAQVIDAILGYDYEGVPINHVYVLTGGVHCARWATYNVTDEKGNVKGQIEEILSSGLVALKHGQGKAYTPSDVISVKEYDQDNDFPFAINSLNRGSYLFTTSFATPTYPRPVKARGSRKISQLWKGPCDNIYTTVKVINDRVQVEFKNQKGRTLGGLDKPFTYRHSECSLVIEENDEFHLLPPQTETTSVSFDRALSIIREEYKAEETLQTEPTKLFDDIEAGWQM